MKPNLRYSFNRSDRSKFEYHVSFDCQKGKSTKDESIPEAPMNRRHHSPNLSPRQAVPSPSNFNATLSQYYQSRCDRMATVMDRFKGKEMECQAMERKMFMVKLEGERLMARLRYLEAKRAPFQAGPAKSQIRLQMEAEIRTFNERIATLQRDLAKQTGRQVERLVKDEQDIQTLIRLLAGAEAKINSRMNSPQITPFNSANSTPKNSTSNILASYFVSAKTSPRLLLTLRKKIHEGIQQLRELQFENDKLRLEFTRKELSRSGASSLANSRLSEKGKATRLQINLQKPELMTMRLKSLEMRVQAERKKYQRECQNRIAEIESSCSTLVTSVSLRTSNSSLELMRNRATQVRGQLAQLELEHQKLKHKSNEEEQTERDLEKRNHVNKRELQLLTYECKVLETQMIRLRNQISVISAENSFEEEARQENFKIIRQIDHINVQISIFRTENNRLSSLEKPKVPAAEISDEDNSQQAEILRKLKQYEYLRELQTKSELGRIKLQIAQRKEQMAAMSKQNKDMTDIIDRRKKALEGGSFEPIMEKTQQSLPTENSERKDTIEDLINSEILGTQGGRTKCVITVSVMILQILVILYILVFQNKQ